MSLLYNLKPCVFYPAGSKKGLKNLILEEGNLSFKRKITVETVNNITYAQDNGKEATKITCDFLFFDQQPSVSKSQELLKTLLENPDAEINEKTIYCYEQAEEFRRMLLHKPSNKYPAYLEHPLFTEKIKVIVDSIQETVGFSTDVGMAKLSVTFIQVDNYGVVPSQRKNKDNVKGQVQATTRPLFDCLFGNCPDRLDKKKLIEDTMFKPSDVRGR